MGIARSRIISDRPDVRVFEIPEGSMTTMDYDVLRVRIFVNASGIVVDEPHIG